MVLYENIQGAVQARKGLMRFISNWFTRPMDFKPRGGVDNIWRLVNAIEQNKNIRRFEITQESFRAVWDNEGMNVKLKSSDGVINGDITYYPPLNPDPDYPLAGVYAEFEFNSEKPGDKNEYEALKSEVSRWRDRRAYNIVFGPH